MTNGSPTAYLLWAILSCIFLAFLFLHLWAYDRFNCLRWDSGRQPGAFKRVMTYSYLATLPLLIIFSVAMTVLKFKEGYIITPDGEITPRPLTLWASDHTHWLLPMYFVLSIGWSLELVTHLEELAFWLFLIHQGPAKREWFHSWEFRTWYLGSMVAVLGMPLVTLVTRREIDRVQPWIFLAGSAASTSTTVAFLYVLARFPGFIRHVKEGGAEPDVVVRLATFYSLNRIRVIFRFLFTIPLLIIAVDALQGPFPVVSDPFALDFLLMMGGIGCFISSAITLLIFFPRSITTESGYRPKVVSPRNSVKVPSVSSPLPHYYHQEAHDHDPQFPKAYESIHSPTLHTPVAARLSSFRYPHSSTLASPTSNQFYQTESLPARPRPSGELEASPGYESDAESFAMESPPIPFHTILHQPGVDDRDQHAHSPSDTTQRQDSFQTATSRPTSGGKSSVTAVWDPQQPQLPILLEPSTSPEPMSPSKYAKAKRRHSDGPFLYNRHGLIVTASEEGPVHQPLEHAREHDSGPSQLHPYVVNFTSPIDLLDTSIPDDNFHPHMV